MALGRGHQDRTDFANAYALRQAIKHLKYAAVNDPDSFERKRSNFGICKLGDWKKEGGKLYDKRQALLQNGKENRRKRKRSADKI